MLKRCIHVCKPEFNVLAGWLGMNFTEHGFGASGTALGCPMVRLAGIEPTTLGFGGQYSIH